MDGRNFVETNNPHGTVVTTIGAVEGGVRSPSSTVGSTYQTENTNARA